MAVVYLAEDLRHGRRVAIKVLRVMVIQNLPELRGRAGLSLPPVVDI
jgi:hypothetical protein